ncbi:MULTISPECIES: YfjI family protein [unclassified Novosphingobium]|uniref:YfjI family protein n=1 Tax=unclassified Novosphingobium TaxID=2644732 RepID=UPI0008691EC7|nr:MULTISPECIES: YfjI family protein [unclassified Novosphingobium]MBN9145182.1 DUF3987 domain-containing protein [Novosphingobium sp.]MDR6709558.1 hypothetical protein [Novosphingobium sp. 1748]ODU78242.1 MAG: hypothetical protein ABT10_23110 [Novosphingobium sp. SCN 63-17]OJX88640.1 MAG: hypothetical protein BGP00_00960 [Novosphingobium sp. 63-713]
MPRNLADLGGSDNFAAWPDPAPLLDELPPVLAFAPALLPGQLRDWVVDIAERMNCPLDLVGIPAMVAAAGLLGRRIGIRPQQRTTWLEVCNLWGVVVASPGQLKSPAAAEALAPIKRLEAIAAKAHGEAMERHAVACDLHKLVSREAEGEAKKRLKEGNQVAALAALENAQAPEPPIARRYLTNDATVEKLGEICRDNPFGLMVHRDELLTLFVDLDHPDKATARGFFLTGWGGQDSYTFDRIGRGTVRIPAVNFSLFGTTQPARLAGYLRESLRRMDDGMAQRLQLLAWPDLSPHFQEVDRYPDQAARETAFACFEELARLNVNEIGAQRDEYSGDGAVPYLHFTPDAQALFSQWWAGLEAKVRGGQLPPALCAHLSKYRGLIPRLALICHLAGDGLGPVSLEATAQALQWADYLESHARRAYASLALTNAEAARAIWRHIAKGDLADGFTLRDIRRKGWAGLGNNALIEGGLERLADADWLGADDAPAQRQGGRPSLRYRINPKALQRCRP